MRLWHKSLIDVLPDKWLLAQWRELCCIATNIKNKGTPNHLLVNKILWYNKSHFYNYCCLVCDEMHNRGFEVSDKSRQKIFDYVDEEARQVGSTIEFDDLFKQWHNDRYLVQCYMNLQEKFDCNGISTIEFARIQNRVSDFIDEELL